MTVKETVKRVLELEEKMASLRKDLRLVQEEYNELMENPYIYDKVNGLKQGGII